MDRKTIYPGQIPLETDLLQTNVNMMVAIGALASALFGSTTIANGLGCGATSPASMQVKVAPGEIYAVENLDDTAYSSLPADTAHQIVKQGISLDAVNLNCPAPTTTGQSICYLIEAAFSEVDSGGTVLPYYNASDPSTAYSGPGNSGASQTTMRRGKVSLQAKAGVAATTGSQTVPAVDSGYIGLWVVTIPYGATTITGSNIAAAANAPVVPTGGLLAAIKALAFASRAEAAAGTSGSKIVSPDTLAQSAQSGTFLYAAASGTNTLTASLTPAPASLPVGMEVIIRAANANTGAVTLNLNGFGAAPVTFRGTDMKTGMMNPGQLYALIYDGTSWQMQAPSQSGVIASALGSTGYEIYQHGRIEQWGYGSAGSDGSFTVTFPTPFPTSCDNVQATNGASSAPASFPGAQILDRFSMKIWSSTSSGVPSPATTAAYWRALGH